MIRSLFSRFFQNRPEKPDASSPVPPARPSPSASPEAGRRAPRASASPADSSRGGAPSGEPAGGEGAKRRRRRRRRSGQGGQPAGPKDGEAAQAEAPSRSAPRSGRPSKNGGQGARRTGGRRGRKPEERPSRGRAATAAARKGPAFDAEGVYEGASYDERGAAEIGLGDFDPAEMSEAFRALNLAPELLRAASALGYSEPTPIQCEAIPLALEGRDLTGCAQTGTGKTAAFALPILHRLMGGTGTRALALTPTRELAVQVAEHFRQLGKYIAVRTAVIYGGVDYEPQFRALAENVDIIVATPGRLLDHMKRKTADFSKLEVLVLDEADRMLDMGFAEEINDILRQIPSQRQTMLFSATLPPTIQALARKALTNPVVISISPPSTPAEGIFHGVYPVSASNKRRAVLEILKQAESTTVLIFTRTKAGADQLCDTLEDAGIDVARIHSDRSQRQRERALTGFKKGVHRVLVATDIVSRGIDVTDISHVINYDVPEYPEDYVHRAGRTARAGSIGYAITLMSPGEIMMVKNIERFIGKALPRVGLPGLQDDIHQKNLGGEPKPLKEQPAVARYERLRKMPRRSGLSLR